MTLLAASMLPPTGIEDLFSRFLPYQALGLAVVLFALTILFWICALTGRFFAFRVRPGETVESKSTPPAPAPPTPTREDPRVIAAIAAAVSVALENQHHLIVDIAPTAKLPPMTSAWAIEGRFQHFSSHKFR